MTRWKDITLIQMWQESQDGGKTWSYRYGSNEDIEVEQLTRSWQEDPSKTLPIGRPFIIYNALRTDGGSTQELTRRLKTYTGQANARLDILNCPDSPLYLGYLEGPGTEIGGTRVIIPNRKLVLAHNVRLVPCQFFRLRA